MTPTPNGLPRDADASGRTMGAEELELLARVIDSGVLNVTRGEFAGRFERAFAARMGAPHAVCCASGSAAVHAAVAALGLDLGDEVVTTAITDMGAIMPLLYEGLVPAFCDVDPATGNVTAETIERALTPRARAVIVTHLFGRACEMAPILELARSRDLVVIEDCAQAYLASDARGMAGQHAPLAVFSLQQSKHITTGEGGIVLAATEGLAQRVRQFVNKGWGYGLPRPDHDFPALNYRMTELQAAVACAQLGKLDTVVARRRQTAAAFLAELDGVAGLAHPPLSPGAAHSYWRMSLQVDPARVAGGARGLSQRLAQRGIAAQPHYIQKPAYQCRVFREWRRFAVTRAVYERAGVEPAPPAAMRRGTEEFLARVLVLPWNEHYSSDDVRRLAHALASAAGAPRVEA